MKEILQRDLTTGILVWNRLANIKQFSLRSAVLLFNSYVGDHKKEMFVIFLKSDW